MNVFSYLDKFSYLPGDEINCMISASSGPITVDLIRLIHGDRSDDGPGFRFKEITSVAPQVVPGRAQETYAGSCMVARNVIPTKESSLRLSVLAWPTLPSTDHNQGILSIIDDDGAVIAALALDTEGCIHIRTNNGDIFARSSRPLSARKWFRIEAQIGIDGCRITATSPETPFNDEPIELTDLTPVNLENANGVVVAALAADYTDDRIRPVGVYNGKLERPRIRNASDLLADWAFEYEMNSSRVVDLSDHGHDGILVNTPTRAMTGHCWTGDTMDFRTAPEEYGAIHFHDDDLSDAGWKVDACIQLPDPMASGIYAVRLQSPNSYGLIADHVPFVVRPNKQTRARVVYLVPSFTYAAYANLQPTSQLEDERLHPLDVALKKHPEFGKSLYDHHSDGSGVCYSSLSRPVVHLRPDYWSWLTGTPRHLGADLCFVDWMDHFGMDHDVITDHDLHSEGASILADYQVVVTGSHPEYYSTQMLDAVEHHVANGRCLMYLGGNGFYWVTSEDSEHPDAVEVRRFAGTRTWEMEPGEQHHSTTGEPGGLWRWRGRAPNKLAGVGMAAQGWDAALGYRRTPESYDAKWKWVFAGIEEELIGDFGLLMGGASGDELDRFDLKLGSPSQTVVLATSEQHSNRYYKVVEDVLALECEVSGQKSPDVRSDMVLVEQPGGGAVFSVGSISFMGSLSWNEYRNNISQLVQNILVNFVERNDQGTEQ